MTNLVIFEDLQKIRQELSEKLDKMKFQIAMVDISNTISELKDKVKVLDSVNLKGINSFVNKLAELQPTDVEKLSLLLDEYKKVTETSELVLEEHISQVLIKTGIVSKLKDEILSKLEDLRKELLSKITIPATIRDIDIPDNGVIELENEIVSVLDFMVPVYYRDDLGRIIIKCMVTPKLTDGKIVLELDDTSKREVGLENGFRGYKTTIQVLTKIKE